MAYILRELNQIEIKNLIEFNKKLSLAFSKKFPKITFTNPEMCTFEDMLGENLMDNENIHPLNLKYTDCINNKNIKSDSNLKDPVSSFFGNLNNP